MQTQLFHDRRQGPDESVDDFAQELRRLYSKAYARFTRGTPQAEKVGQAVLASQFVAGLRPGLQAKVVGMEGEMDQLVLRAHFEEAKNRGLAAARSAMSSKLTSKNNHGSPTGAGVTRGNSQKTVQTQDVSRAEGNTRKCFNCGLEGHLARSCTYPRTGKKETEAKGRKGNVTSLHDYDDVYMRQ